jgi:hypothetical protein
MNENSISLSGRIAFPHTYVLASNTFGWEEESVLAPSDRFLTRLQLARLATQEVTDPYFKGDKVLIGQTISDLKAEKIIPWKKINNAKFIFISQKALQIALKKILRDREWERLYEYLRECRRKLKENFQKFYLKIIEEKEELKRFQIKNQ